MPCFSAKLPTVPTALVAVPTSAAQHAAALTRSAMLRVPAKLRAATCIRLEISAELGFKTGI